MFQIVECWNQVMNKNLYVCSSVTYCYNQIESTRSSKFIEKKPAKNSSRKEFNWILVGTHKLPDNIG